jgi:hypothetical protein
MRAAATMSSVKAEASTVELGLARITESASATSTQDISASEPLEQVQVEFFGPEGQNIIADALLDNGANITAMPASQVVICTPLGMSQVLKAADGTILRIIGVVKMEICL